MSPAELSALNTLTAALLLAPSRWADLVSDARRFASTPAMRGALDALADAFASGVPDPPARRTCAQLEARCGVDDFGTACGTCPRDFMCVGTSCRFREECLCGARICGLDPCGVISCGTCPSGSTCTSGNVCR